jgi:SH3-like domain-containing protein
VFRFGNFASACALIAVLVLAGCNVGPQQKLPQAYIAPATVNLRPQLNQRTTSVTVLKHGERVSIVDVRRRYVKVKAANGAEGWVDSSDLLTPEEMRRIQRERAAALKLPSEGKASAYEKLNIHLDPSRKSPAFTQIPEGGVVEVLARRIVPRNSEPPKQNFVLEKPQPPVRRSRKDRAARSSLKPPKPPAPKPPARWQQLWGAESEAETAESETRTPAKENSRPEKPAVLEAWLLVRTKDNQVGWALARNLMMAIPDEVAQYAGGAHITSYFDLGAVNDEREGTKHNWLWTTASGTDNVDFDAWRVFLWNRRRHRYETSYRKRDLIGYFPVQVDPPDPTRFGRTFHIITKDDDGRLRRRTYLFDGTLVHLIATEDYARAAEQNAGANTPATRNSASKPPSWFSRQWTRLKSALKKEHQ